MARPNGQIRRGQIIKVFGPGALMKARVCPTATSNQPAL